MPSAKRTSKPKGNSIAASVKTQLNIPPKKPPGDLPVPLQNGHQPADHPLPTMPEPTIDQPPYPPKRIARNVMPSTRMISTTAENTPT